MRIASVEIQNFRSLSHLKLQIDPLTKLLGANNAGKSTVLSAIELFFDPAPKITELDHHKKNTREPISITIEFADLTPVEMAEFSTALIDERLRVTRDFSYASADANVYAVAARVNPDFSSVRSEGGNRKLAAYRELAARYNGELPPARSAADVDDALLNWEIKHPEALKIERIRSFFGAPNVANGKLTKKTTVRLIPAVKEVGGEFRDPKRSPIVSLLSDIARQSIENQEELRLAVERASATISELMDPTRYPQLADISGQLTSSLQKYYASCRIDADWMPGRTLDLVPPVPRIQVESNGIPTPIESVGHGLQRAVLFSLIEFLASNSLRQAPEGGEFREPASDIILLIEEPEIYQHPSKQVTISSALTSLTKDFNRQTGIRIQAIFSTHSEKFVDMHSLSDIRILQKNASESYVPRCNMCSISDVTKELSQVLDPPREPMPDVQFAAKLHIFNREVSEGFFADKVILVEGVGDKAAMQSIYHLQKRNPDAEGIVVIQVDGKTKLDKPWVVFRRLGIKTYVIFDNDAGKNLKEKESNDIKQYNKLLQRIGGKIDAEDFPVGVYSQYCAMNGNLETRIKLCLGQHCDEILGQLSSEYGVAISGLCKSPAAVRAIFNIGRSRGIEFEAFNEIIAAVDAL